MCEFVSFEQYILVKTLFPLPTPVPALDKINEIRSRRERRFHEQRFKAAKKHDLVRAKQIVRKHSNVLVTAAAGFRVSDFIAT